MNDFDHNEIEKATASLMKVMSAKDLRTSELLTKSINILFNSPTKILIDLKRTNNPKLMDEIVIGGIISVLYGYSDTTDESIRLLKQVMSRIEGIDKVIVKGGI